MIQDVKEVNMIDRILNEISALSPKEIREIFMQMWRHMDSLNDGLTADIVSNFCNRFKRQFRFDL